LSTPPAGRPERTGPGFGVIIPMYNEEAGAEKCVRDVCATLSRIEQRCGLLVVEDGSRDRTFEILEKAALCHPKLKVIRHPRNLGYGRALRTGVEQAARERYDYALFMDSDLTNSPSDIPRFCAEMERGTDVIKASRFTAGGRMEGVPLRRALVSRLGNVVARLLFGIGLHDCTNGFRALRVPILERMNLNENGFAIIVEELYQAKFLASSYAEIPVVLTSRSEDLRPTSFGYGPSIFFKYLRYAVKARLGIRPRLRGEA
jgi:dolichol-phosphate mannosyltransferase